MDKTTMNAQIERFRKGFPWLRIVAPAVPGNGIEVLDEAAQDAAVRADACIGCNACLRKCPQHISIPLHMQRIQELVKKI